MLKKILAVQCAILLLLLSACQMKNRNLEVDSSGSVPNSSADDELTLPTSEVFALTGADALLYDAMVSAYASEIDSSYVCIPRLGIVETYQDDCGNTCYVCQCHTNIYLSSGELAGEEILWVCITVLRDSDKTVPILKSKDGDVWAESIRELCGPLTDLADAIIAGEEVPEITRNIPELEEAELLRACLRSSR